MKVYDPTKNIIFTVQVPRSEKEFRSSIPYSSYCKGYGESHMKKLGSPIDYEIDGLEIWDFEKSQGFSIVNYLSIFESEDL
jgi:hypothetical protein